MASDISMKRERSLANWTQTYIRPVINRMVNGIGLNNLGLLIYVGFSAMVLLLAIFKPEYNWDMAAYIASALQDNFDSAEALHKEVWSLMREGSSEANFYELSAGNAYNLHNYESPSAFVSMLPMFDIKIAYIGTIELFSGLMDIVNASIFVSILSSLAVCLICLYWMYDRNILQTAPIVVLMLLLCNYLYMSRIVTPDLAVAVFILAGAERFMKGKDWLAAVLFFVAFLYRPDAILFIFAMLLSAIFFRAKFIPALVSFIAAMAVSVWLSTSPTHVPWWTHFYFSCVEIQNTMVGFHPDFNPITYLKGLARGMMVSLRFNNWPMLFGLLVVGWGLMGAKGIRFDSRANVLIFGVVLAFGGKFIVFPLPDDRLYMPLLIAFLMALLETWKPTFDGLFSTDASSEPA